MIQFKQARIHNKSMFPSENGRDAAASNSVATNNKINTPTGHKQKGCFKNNAGNKKNITSIITKSSRAISPITPAQQ